jgi:uracil-DNA glycosylase family 4
VENVTDRTSNPFGMSPSCDRFVPGYGDANADFHVIGDHSGVHGGRETTVPFTNEAGMRLQRSLSDVGLIDKPSDKPDVNGTFLSYLHMCVVDGTPTEHEYVDMERFFDAELRAIAAHVLLPVGERATRHVLETFTARTGRAMDMEELHADEIRGSGFLVYPILDPDEWTKRAAEQLVQALSDLQATDFYREVDLGRFLPSDEPYHVR